MFGKAVAIDDQTALVGAYNRDTYVTGTNGGSGFSFDLKFLNVAFSASTYTVTEGLNLAISVYRCGSTGGSCYFGSL